MELLLEVKIHYYATMILFVGLSEALVQINLVYTRSFNNNDKKLGTICHRNDIKQGGIEETEAITKSGLKDRYHSRYRDIATMP